MISISTKLACRRQLYESTAHFFSTSPFGKPFSSEDYELRKARKAYTGKPHPRNTFQGTYDMDRLVTCYPILSPYIIKGPTGRLTVDWADPVAVRALNTALLVADYNVNPSYSDILPQDSLVPPVPGRADYVHHVADLLQNCTSKDENDNADQIPKGSGVIGFDIGTGASCIYATISASVYGWRMIASDIKKTSIESANRIVTANELDDLIDVRHQKISDSSIFDGILEQDERIDFCMCNPPFYHNREEFVAENTRKLKGLAKSRGQLKKADRDKATNKNEVVVASSNNFGGLESELICNGGEVRFVKRIFKESKMYWDRCLWFTTLVSRNDNLNKIKRSYMMNKKGRRRIRKGDREIKVIDQIPIGAGKKKSNILIWTFMDEDQRRDWARRRNWDQ